MLMNILSVCALGIIGAIFAITVKNIRPEIAVVISLATGIIILLYLINDLSEVFYRLEAIAENYDLNSGYFKIAIKVCTIAYITQFAKELCKDCGESAIGTKIELCGKVSIIIMSMPIISGFLNGVAELLEKI